MPDNVSAPHENPYPTGSRWCIVAVATLMSTMMYLDRFCVPFAQSFIQEDLGLTPKQTASLMSAFFWAYALAQIPSGWLSDRWGGRIMLTIYILSWSLFTLLIGWSTGLWTLVAMQVGHGLGQAGAYPTSAGLLSHWMPLGTRGTASSIVAFGGRLGGFLAPILTAWLIVLFVPVEKSSLLTPRQLKLSEVRAFSLRMVPIKPESYQASPEPQKELIGEIWKSLPQESQDLLQRRADNSAQELSGAEFASLVNGLNQVLEQPELSKAQSVVGLNLTREASSLMTRRDQGTSLSSLQTQRLNRLVLEALFPKFVGKVYVQGWRQVFVVYGIVGAFIAIVFWLVVRNRPQEHPWCNSAELELIQAGRDLTPPTPAPQQSLPWGQVLCSSGLWLSSISQVATNIGWLFVAAKLPDYLKEVHNVEIIQRGYLSSLPMFGGVAGLLLGGHLTDWMRLKFGLRWGRAIPMSATRLGSAAAYLGCLMVNDPYVATVLCMIVAFFTDMGVAATWAFMQDAGGRYVGVVLGFGNMWGNIGAAVAPQIYGAALDLGPQGWNICFVMCAAAMIVSGVAGLFIDATKPIIEDDRK